MKKRPINLNPNGLKLEQSYWADTYTKNDGEMPHVYNKALNMEALAATQCLYTNIIKKDEQEIFSAIQSCPIRFKADAKKRQEKANMRFMPISLKIWLCLKITDMHLVERGKQGL